MHCEQRTRNRLILILTILLFWVFAGLAAGATPKNVIILIGDGMGFEQVKAAGMYKNGTPGTLVFESFPHTGQVTTYSSESSVTDSAAAATAIATGFKVNNYVVSKKIPGDGSELQTLLEYFKALGKSTGLVTTTYITHATPACFGAHENDRNSTPAIAGDYLNQTRPNVLFGGGANGMSASSAQDAGYTVVTNAAQLLALDTETAAMVSGQFGSAELPYELSWNNSPLPHLSQMAETSLHILDNDPDGFLLMIEGGLIDWAGHANDLPNNVWETIEFANAVQKVVDWAAGRTDTLIIVTADHETGGLTVTANNGINNFPSVTWSTGGHTGVNVPVYAWGANSNLISGTMDNTGFFAVATASTGPAVNISGFVKTPGGSPIQGVVVAADSGGGTGSTAANGYYTLAVPAGWSGAVRPAKASYVFDPPSRQYAGVVADTANQNFSGTKLPLVCQGFETGYSAGSELRTHPDWFYEDIHTGPVANPGIGVAGSWGLTNGDRIFTWVAHGFTWSEADLTGMVFRMDFQTDGSGRFDDDRIGWMISDTDDESTHFFGVQLDPLNSGGYDIEGYWEDSAGTKRYPVIAALPSLTANAWYRLQLEVTKIGATAARLDVNLWSLNAAGSELSLAATGSIADTAALGSDAPHSKYFTASRMWPAYKNFDTIAGAADNACFSASGCAGDFDGDGDVDGRDLYELAVSGDTSGLEDFTRSFGQTGCPL